MIRCKYGLRGGGFRCLKMPEVWDRFVEDPGGMRPHLDSFPSKGHWPYKYRGGASLCVSPRALSEFFKEAPDVIERPPDRPRLALTPSCPTSSSKSTKSSDPSPNMLVKLADRLRSILLAAVGRLKSPLFVHSGRAQPWETLCTSSLGMFYTLAVLDYV